MKNGKTTPVILPDLTGTHFGIQNLILLHKEKNRVCVRIVIVISKKVEGLIINGIKLLKVVKVLEGWYHIKTVISEMYHSEQYKSQ